MASATMRTVQVTAGLTRRLIFGWSRGLGGGWRGIHAMRGYGGNMSMYTACRHVLEIAPIGEEPEGTACVECRGEDDPLSEKTWGSSDD